MAIVKLRDDKCLHKEVSSIFREEVSNVSNAVEGKSACPRDGGDDSKYSPLGKA